MRVEAFYILNSNQVVIDHLRESMTGAVINHAGVTCTIIGPDGEPLAGEDWPLPMAFQPGSQGRYIGQLKHDLPYVADSKYTAVIDADAGAGVRGHWEVARVARVRSS